MALFGHQDIAKLAKMLMEAQQAPVRRTFGAELQAPRNQSLIDQLRHYKPTEEQRLQALKDMANISKDRTIQVIAEYAVTKLGNNIQLPRQIEMPTFLNVSEYKIVNFIFDKLEGILPK